MNEVKDEIELTLHTFFSKSSNPFFSWSNDHLYVP